MKTTQVSESPYLPLRKEVAEGSPAGDLSLGGSNSNLKIWTIIAT